MLCTQESEDYSGLRHSLTQLSEEGTQPFPKQKEKRKQERTGCPFGRLTLVQEDDHRYTK